MVYRLRLLAGAGLLSLALAACQSPPDGQSASGPATAADAAVDETLRRSAEQAEAAFDYRAAAEHYTKLMTRSPGDRGIVLKLAKALRYSGQTQPAIDLLLAWTEQKDDKGADMLGELGKAFLAADRGPVALRYLREADAARPGQWDVLSAMGVAQDSLGDHANAQDSFNRALAAAPDNPVVLNNLGLSLAASGDLPQAVAMLRRANDQPRANAQMRLNLAMLLALSGDPAGAERVARGDLTAEQLREHAALYLRLAKGRM